MLYYASLRYADWGNPAFQVKELNHILSFVDKRSEYNIYL
jgi:hypothetical protein